MLFCRAEVASAANNYDAKPKVSLKPFQRLAESRDSVSGGSRAAPLVGSKGKALSRRLWRRNIIIKSKSPLRKQSSELFANMINCRLQAGERNSPLQNVACSQSCYFADARRAPLQCENITNVTAKVTFDTFHFCLHYAII